MPSSLHRRRILLSLPVVAASVALGVGALAQSPGSAQAPTSTTTIGSLPPIPTSTTTIGSLPPIPTTPPGVQPADADPATPTEAQASYTG